MSAKELLATLEIGSSKPDAEAIFRDRADLFSEGLLGHKAFPEDYFALLLEVLSRPTLFGVRGSEMFLSEAYWSFDDMSQEQKERLLSVLEENYPAYEREDLCWVASDFLARLYPTAVVFDAIDRIAPKVSRREQSNGLLLALDILRKTDDNRQNGETLARIRRKEEAILNERAK